MPVYEFFNNHIPEEQVGQRLSAFSIVSVPEVLARYKRVLEIPNMNPAEQRAAVVHFEGQLKGKEALFGRVREHCETQLRSHLTPAYFDDVKCMGEFFSSAVSSCPQYRALKDLKQTWVEREGREAMAAEAERAVMALQEAATFRSIVYTLSRVEKWHLDNQESLETVEDQIKQVEGSSSQTFGFLRRVSRQDKLASLTAQKVSLEQSIRSGEELLNVGYALISSREIPHIRRAVHRRHAELVNGLSKDRVGVIQVQLEFWKKMREAAEEREEKSP